MKTLLLFPGQGSQVVTMGKSWYDSSPIVRHYFQQADQALPFPLSKICFEGPESVLRETHICQPALFVIGYAIVEHLKQAGIFEKNPLIGATGISLGELTALACAGVFDFETGLQMIAERGRLMQAACDAYPTGMVALMGGTEDALQKLCCDFDLDISNRNCPGQTVVSGTLPDLERVQFFAKERGFKLAIPLKVAGAYHSRWMQPAREQFELFLKKVSFHVPQIPVISNTTGESISNPKAIQTALGLQLTAPVLFEKCLRYCSRLNGDIGLECGPGNVVSGLAKRTDASLNIRSASMPNVLEFFK